MQVTELHKDIDALQALYGDASLQAVYGAGCIEKPEAMLMFMNPTAKNVSSSKSWKGLRAPWLGTKNIWSLLHTLDLISEEQHARTQTLKANEWTEEYSEAVYGSLKEKGIYVTNLAKCTQLDARPLKDDVFRQYLDLMKREIALIQPKRIITFGNQVSSILLNTPIRVSSYSGTEQEEFAMGDTVYPVYPTYYPVGHGRMNQPQAIARMTAILKQDVLARFMESDRMSGIGFSRGER